MSRAAPLEIVIRPVETGWTWALRLYGVTTIRRGRAGNVCVAVIEAAEALALERACGEERLQARALAAGAIETYRTEEDER